MKWGVALVVLTVAWTNAAFAQLGAPRELASSVALSSTADSQEARAVAFDGERYVIAYSDRTTPYGLSRFARVTTDGSVIDEIPIALPTYQLACAAGMCVAVGFRDEPGGGLSMVLNRFDVTTGGVVGSTEVLGSYADFGSSPDVRVAAVGSSLLLVQWSADEPPTLRTVLPAGLGPAVVVADIRAFQVDLACSSALCLVSWYDAGVHFRRFDASGAPLDAGTVSLAPSTLIPLTYLTAFNGTAFEALASSPSEFGAHYVIGVDGVEVAAATRLGVISALRAFGCAANGVCEVVTGVGASEPAFVACEASTCASAETVSVRTVAVEILSMNADGITTVAEFGVGLGADVHRGPVALAPHIALFQRDVSTGIEVVSRLLDDTGVPLDSEHVVATSFFLGPLDVVVGEGGFGCLVPSSTGTAFQRLDALGAPVDGPVSVGDCVTDAALAWNGTHYLLACVTSAGSATVRRLDAVGQRVEASPVALVPSNALEVDVALDPAGAWSVAVATVARLRAYRVLPDGTLPDSTGTLIRDARTTLLASAALPDGVVLSWDESDVFAGTHDVRVAKLAADSVMPLSGLSLSLAGDIVNLALDGGARPTLAWATRGDVGRTISMAPLGADLSLGTPTLVHMDGVSFLNNSSEGLAISSTPLAVAYGAAVADPTLAPLRTFVRGAGSVSASCSVPSDCASGFCVSGACCDRACDGVCETCVTGVCGARPAGTVCRAAGGACDAEEMCDGTTASCPADTLATCEDVTLDGGVASDVGSDGGRGADAGGGAPGAGCACSAGSRGRTPLWLGMLVLALAGPLGRYRPRSRTKRPGGRP